MTSSRSFVICTMSRVCAAVVTVLSTAGCGSDPIYNDDVYLSFAFDNSSAIAPGPLVLRRGTTHVFKIHAGQAGDKYQLGDYEGQLLLTAMCPTGIEASPASWDLTMQAEKYYTAEASFELMVLPEVAIGRHVLSVDSKRDDGKTGAIELRVEVVAAAPAEVESPIEHVEIYDSAMREQWSFVSLARCFVRPAVAPHHFADAYDSGRYETSLFITADTRIERIDGEMQLPADIWDLKRGATIRWDFSALWGHPNVGYNAIARSVVILQPGE
jgi:hypothetical protein